MENIQKLYNIIFGH
ncbi:hypothetical protein Pint_10856 [Pistacia integerrima]|uniref:Uncharacterized protein n=1 Tax=Pistacia integerrima TaxID=434235 RepID=A0ACC0XJX4_9ROSI|nr:hypothetical protein Pint_10856 [Pistacia integerrima]